MSPTREAKRLRVCLASSAFKDVQTSSEPELKGSFYLQLQLKYQSSANLLLTSVSLKFNLLTNATHGRNSTSLVPILQSWSETV